MEATIKGFGLRVRVPHLKSKQSLVKQLCQRHRQLPARLCGPIPLRKCTHFLPLPGFTHRRVVDHLCTER